MVEDEYLRINCRVLRQAAGEVTKQDVALAAVSKPHAKVMCFGLGAVKRPVADEASKLAMWATRFWRLCLQAILNPSTELDQHFR